MTGRMIGQRIRTAADRSTLTARLASTACALMLATSPVNAQAGAQVPPPCVGTSGAGSERGSTAVGVVRWSPTTPRTGTLFRIRMSTAAVLRSPIAAASVAGEPIHFQTIGDSSIALAAVPIDSANGIALVIRCESGAIDTIRIPTQGGNYRLERLRVAPRFSNTPDSALSARMQREAEQAAVVSRGAHETPRMWTASFATPRSSRITSGFGGGRTFNGTVTSRHMGTDFAGAIGAPVRATNRGIVRVVGTFYLGGNVIYLDHGAGIVTAYLHLSRQLVQVGDTIARGAVIGEVGATGRVTGPHLHLIARYGSITVDPASLFVRR